jgi:hypothetical protein
MCQGDSRRKTRWPTTTRGRAQEAAPPRALAWTPLTRALKTRRTQLVRPAVPDPSSAGAHRESPVRQHWTARSSGTWPVRQSRQSGRCESRGAVRPFRRLIG